MEQRILRTRCSCGWESVGPEAEVVVATLDHGRLIHNMDGTPDQVLARAELVLPDDPAPPAV